MSRQDSMVGWEENCTWVNMAYTMDCHVQPPANSCVATSYSHD